MTHFSARVKPPNERMSNSACINGISAMKMKALYDPGTSRFLFLAWRPETRPASLLTWDMLPRRRFDFKHSSQTAIWLGLNVRFARLTSPGIVVYVVHPLRFLLIVRCMPAEGKSKAAAKRTKKPVSIYLSSFQLCVIVCRVITYLITPPSVSLRSIIGNGTLVKQNWPKTSILAMEFLRFPRLPKEA